VVNKLEVVRFLRLKVIRINLTASEVDLNTSSADLDVAESVALVVVGSKLKEIDVGQLDPDFPSLVVVDEYLEVRLCTDLGSDIYRCIKFGRNADEVGASARRAKLHADCIVFLLRYKDLLA
jgi:hypothetical protein